MTKREPLEQRFWKKVNKFGKLWTDPETGITTNCWEWTASLHSHGYGQIADDYNEGNPLKVLRAHRTAWEFKHGKIPDGQLVCHKCDNPRCVNDSHLFLGTQQQNMSDMITKGRNGSTLTDIIVLQIRGDYPTKSLSVLAKEHHIDKSAVSLIVNRKRRKHI